MEFDDILNQYDYALPEDWSKLSPMKLKANMLKYMRETAPTYMYSEFSKKLTCLSDAKLKKEVKRMDAIDRYYND